MNAIAQLPPWPKSPTKPMDGFGWVGAALQYDMDLNAALRARLNLAVTELESLAQDYEFRSCHDDILAVIAACKEPS